ncbi:uncharacterized protein LOC117570948 [Drosophila albomicans]|uniref:Uncharacterized protein LOC117570948 n=1 Tax=Drosophila albomicans TaxID=7291 RepID=A0A6P8YSE2_DROAB|nr:uncharacterized protein LOC117570948 [Drosophila albomicans]
MKVVLLILIVCSLYEFVLAQSAADLAAYKAMQQQCITELKISAAEAAQIASDKLVANPSEAYKCFHSCLYKKLGLITGEQPNDAAILKFAQARFNKISQDKIKTELKACSAPGPANCDFVYKYEMCVAKALTA